MCDDTRALVDYYAKRARYYESVYDKPERQDDLRRLMELVADRFFGADVFEVACGTGYWTEIVARSAASVFATDINEEVLAVARAKPVDRSRVRFEHADACALPVLAQTFTAGFGGFWWSHIRRARIQDFLRGFHRVLSPGARVMFIDNTFVEGSSTPIARTDPEGNTYQLRRLEDGSQHEVLKNFPTESELVSAVGPWATEATVEHLRYFWVLQYTLRRDPLAGPPGDRYLT